MMDTEAYHGLGHGKDGCEMIYRPIGTEEQIVWVYIFIIEDTSFGHH